MKLNLLEEIAVATTVCPRCEAKPRVMCTSVTTGEPADDVHVSRTAPVLAGYTLASFDRDDGIDRDVELLTFDELAALHGSGHAAIVAAVS